MTRAPAAAAGVGDPICNDDADVDARHRARVLRFGRHPQAWATLQPGVQIVDVGHGSVACRRALGVPVVLGDPVCAPHHRAAVVDAVVDALPGALFFQTSDDVARRLHERHGWYATPLGIQPLVDVARFSLRGRHKQALRSALNRAARTGVDIHEVDADDLDDAPVRGWLRTRRRRRLSFVVPPLRMPAACDGVQRRRAFVATNGRETLGFVVFDPLHDDGVVVGWTPSVSCGSMRFRPGLWYALVAHALLQFQREGAVVVDLGLAPLAPLTPQAPSQSPWLRTMFSVLSSLGLLYNFRGIAHAKSRFGGASAVSWLGHRRALPLVELLALWHLIDAPAPLAAAVTARHRPPVGVPARGYSGDHLR